MRRSFKFLLRPTRKQRITLTAMLADRCDLYNAAWQERRDAYAHPSKTAIRYGEQSAQLKDIRAGDPGGQGRWSFTSQQQTLRRLAKAFRAFFRRIKNGQRPGYPRFKGRGWFDTVTLVEGDGVRCDSQPHRPGATYVRVQGIGHLRVHQHNRRTGQDGRAQT